MAQYREKLRKMLLVVSTCVLFFCGVPALAQDASSAQTDEEGAVSDELAASFDEELDVLGLAPTDAEETPVAKAPWVVHGLDEAQLEETLLSLTALLQAAVPGTALSEPQGSSLQPDLSYRGFGASPLLGAGQGLSIYVDGVRTNEVFGDIVSWDVLPTFALREVEFVPGSNPVFGLNTLGGALSLRIRDGSRDSRLGVGLEAGTDEWYAGDFSYGRAWSRSGSEASRSLFAGARFVDDGGWRDFSPSDVRQGVIKTRWARDVQTVSVAIDAADNSLTGNGAVPIELLAVDRDAVFTHPDETDNQVLFPRARLERRLGEQWSLSAQAHLRDGETSTFNADALDDDDDDDLDDDHDDDDDDDDDDDHDDDRDDDDDDDDDDFNAVNNSSLTEQQSLGFSAQMSRSVFGSGGGSGAGGRLLLGVSWDRGEADFVSESELAVLLPSRTTLGAGQLLPGSEVGVEVETEHRSAFVSWLHSPKPRLSWLLQARYGWSSIVLDDQLGTSLDGDHEFNRLLPSVGLVWDVSSDSTRSSMQLFANLSESSRVPTPVELTCADPEDPCRLPNAFVSDPPLEQVVTRGGELGVRARWGRVSMSAAGFASDTRDDIVFVSSGAATSAGFFRNIDKTRRRGLELSARGVSPNWRWDASYTFVEATFGTDLVISSPAHPLAVDGEIPVESGDLIPGVPRHQWRAGVSARLGRFWLGGRARYDSGRFARGDEGNLLPEVPGAFVADVTTRVVIGTRVNLSLDITNVFDREYSTFGALGEASEILGDGFSDPRFESPGAPLQARFGLELRFN